MWILISHSNLATKQKHNNISSVFFFNNNSVIEPYTDVKQVKTIKVTF